MFITRLYAGRNGNRGGLNTEGVKFTLWCRLKKDKINLTDYDAKAECFRHQKGLSFIKHHF